jgi:hypothetical protein
MLERSGSPDVFYWGFLLGFMGVYRVYFGIVTSGRRIYTSYQFAIDDF